MPNGGSYPLRRGLLAVAAVSGHRAVYLAKCCRGRVVDTFVSALEIIKPEYAPQYYEYAYGMAAPAVRRVLEESWLLRPGPSKAPSHANTSVVERTRA